MENTLIEKIKKGFCFDCNIKKTCNKKCLSLEQFKRYAIPSVSREILKFCEDLEGLKKQEIYYKTQYIESNIGFINKDNKIYNQAINDVIEKIKGGEK